MSVFDVGIIAAVKRGRTPVERIWLHLKERLIAHRVRTGCDAIADVAHRREPVASQKQSASHRSAHTLDHSFSNGVSDE